MYKKHSIDSELFPYAEPLIQFASMADLNDLPACRALMNQGTQQLLTSLPAEAEVSIEDQMIPGRGSDPEVRVRLYRPTESQGPLPAVLWIHGGGYLLGTPEQDEVSSITLCKTLRCVVVSVDYRLAPEAPYPAGLHDCYAALAWLNSNATGLDIDPARIAVAGASAGGGLSAALSLLVRDKAEYQLCYQVLIYPMIDDSNIQPADEQQYPDTKIWNRQANIYAWGAYLGGLSKADDVPIYAAPYRAETLEGLPPALVTVGDVDLFLNENLNYAQRLMRAGVQTELHVYPGGYHGFVTGAAQTSVGQHINQAIYRALSKAFAV